jgi:large subunit ribosomal protein L28
MDRRKRLSIPLPQSTMMMQRLRSYGCVHGSSHGLTITNLVSNSPLILRNFHVTPAVSSTTTPLVLSLSSSSPSKSSQQWPVHHPSSLTSTSSTAMIDFQRRFRSNRSERGLYDGKDIRTGNNLSFSMKSTKRTFKPNVFKKRVYSEILDEMIQFHLTTSALRSIDKAGGLDNYLLTSRHITSGEGLAAKNRIIGRLKYLERVASRQEQQAGGGGETVSNTATSSD